MEVTSFRHDEVVVVSIRGSIDSLNADQVTEAFTTHLESGAVRLVADFEGVVYTSSAGRHPARRGEEQSAAGG